MPSRLLASPPRREHWLPAPQRPLINPPRRRRRHHHHHLGVILPESLVEGYVVLCQCRRLSPNIKFDIQNDLLICLCTRTACLDYFCAAYRAVWPQAKLLCWVSGRRAVYAWLLLPMVFRER